MFTLTRGAVGPSARNPLPDWNAHLPEPAPPEGIDVSARHRAVYPISAPPAPVLREPQTDLSQQMMLVHPRTHPLAKIRIHDHGPYRQHGYKKACNDRVGACRHMRRETEYPG